MGACFNYRIYCGSQQNLPLWWDEVCAKAVECHGTDGYSGDVDTLQPGVDIKSMKPLGSKQEAIDYLEEKAQKWEMALAVPFIGQVQQPRKDLVNAQLKLKDAEKDLQFFLAMTLKRYQSTKSKTIGCKHCGSSITRRFLHYGGTGEFRMDSEKLCCPVCGNNLMTESDEKTLKLRRDKVSVASSLVCRLSDQKDTVSGVNWVVGGLCSE